MAEVYEVIIVAENQIYREGLRSVLEALGTLKVVAGVGDGKQVAQQVEKYAPDIVLLEVKPSEQDSLDVAKQLKMRYPQVRVVLLAEQESDEGMLEAIRAGAAHYLPIGITPERLVAEIVAVGQGRYPINEAMVRPKVAENVLRQFDQLLGTGDSGVLYTPLTTREHELLALIAAGQSNKEIARSLAISDQTVKNHITSILRKLQVNDRTSAVVYAFRKGWIKPNADLDFMPISAA